MPRNTGIGVIIGGLAFVLGFAMVWHIWWLAIAAGLGILIAVALRTFDDDTEFVMSAAEVQAIEDRHRQVLAAAPTHVHTPVRNAALAQGVP
jgi:cytochrome o ubiquinol oxidase subunit 1